MTVDAPRRHLLIVVALPDRPGALGAVASRIGALGTDITDIHLGDRGGDCVDTTFHLDLPRTADDSTAGGVDIVEVLLGELHEVDGVAVRSQTEATCCARS